MKLSEDLVREFAEVTNDTKKDENPEPTCYGTASFQGEQGYVQIDGSDFLTPATFTVGAEQGDRVLVVIKGRKALVIGNITNPVLLVGTLKAANGIVVNGWLTTNEKRTTYNDWTKAGLTFSNGGIGAYGGVNKYWYLTNGGEFFANSATITGDITATSLTLSGNAKIPSGKVEGLSAVATSGDAYDILNLKPIATSGLAKDVGGLAPIATDGKWSSLVNNPMLVYLDSQGVLTSGRYGEGTVGFVISKDGLLQASNAIIYGTIFASAGKIGGLALDSKSIHTLNVGIGSNASGSIGFSSENFTRYVAGANREGLRLAIGSGFGVDHAGKLYASGAYIVGDIVANSLNLGTNKIDAKTNISNLATVATSGKYTDLLGTESIDAYFDSSGVLRRGAAPSATTKGFKVDTYGLLQASNAIIWGTIYATAGEIGNLTLREGMLFSNEHSAWDSNKAGVYIGSDRISLGPGGKFNVANDGKLTAKDADVKGKITATTLILEGTSIDAKTQVSNLHAVATSGKYTDLTNRISTVYFDTSTGKLRAGTVGDGKTGFQISEAGKLEASTAVIWGTIYASAGKIGGLAIESNSIHTLNVLPTVSADGSFAITSTNFTRAINKVDRSGLRLAIGTNFGVTSNGVVYATNAVVSGAITANSLTLGTSAASTINNMIDAKAPDLSKINAYFDSSGKLRKGSAPSATTKGFSVDLNGYLEASNAMIWGTVYSTAGEIAGLTIKDNAIRSGELNATAAGSFAISSKDFSRSINNESRTNLRFAIGGNFAVKNDGTLYASGVDIAGKIKSTNAEITGKITANEGKIGAFTITKVTSTGGGALYSGSHDTLKAKFDGVYIGSDGIGLGNGGKFVVGSNGIPICNGADLIINSTVDSGVTSGLTIMHSDSQIGYVKAYYGSPTYLYIRATSGGVVIASDNSTVDVKGYSVNLQATTSDGVINLNGGTKGGTHVWNGSLFVESKNLLVKSGTVWATNGSVWARNSVVAGESATVTDEEGDSHYAVYNTVVIKAKNAYSSVSLRVHGNSTTEHGIWSDTGDRWMIYRTASSHAIIIPESLTINKENYLNNLTATNGNGSTTSPKNIVVGGVSPVLTFSYKNQLGKVKSVQAIRAFGDNEDGTNNGIVLLGSNTGATIITSGEEAPYLIRTKGISNNENTYVIADGSFVVYTGASHTSATTDSITTITGTAKEAMNIGTNGYVQVLNYANYLRVAITSASDDGKRVSAVRCDSSTSFSVHGQWGTTGSTYSYKTITTSASDIRLKENIVFSNAKSLALINRIPLYEFDWKDGRHWDVGFVADYIVNVDPRLAIIRKSDDEYSSIDTYYMTGHIVKAIQELSILHNDHEDRITALEKENRYLKEQLKQLTAA